LDRQTRPVERWVIGAVSDPSRGCARVIGAPSQASIDAIIGA